MKLHLSGIVIALMVLLPGQANAESSDPVASGWMQGFPPPPDKIIRNDQHGYDFPQRRWSYSHWRELKPTANVWRGPGAATPMPSAPALLGDVTYQGPDGIERAWKELPLHMHTDGILVMHRGKVVEEKYFGALDANTPHVGMSMSKSFVGTLAAMLVEDGTIDESALVGSYVPELADTGYGDATVRQVMDMLVSVHYSEDYLDPNADVFALTFAAGVLIPPPEFTGPDNIYDYLRTIKKEGDHGKAFAYRSSGTEVLAWIMAKATGKPLNQLFSDMIWRKLGAEHDAYINVDRNGTVYAAGGINTTLRDLARLGEMIRLDGQYNGQQIIAKAVIDDIRNGGDPAKFGESGQSYRNMWWISHDEDGAFSAMGFNGQRLYINPKAEIVIAHYGSHYSPNGARDIHPYIGAACAAVARHLDRRDQ